MKKYEHTDRSSHRWVTIGVTALLRGPLERKRSAAENPVTANLLDQELQRPPGGDQRSEEARTNVNNVNVGRPVGNATATALRKLRKDAPELHAKVLAKEMTAHAAMVQAGFRPRTATVRLDNAQSMARVLRKVEPPVLAELLRLLNKEVTPQ